MAQRERELEEQYKHLEEEVEDVAAKETSLSSSVNNTENIQKLIDSTKKEDELIQNNEKYSAADRIEDDDDGNDDDNEFNYDEDEDDDDDEEEDINQTEDKTTNIIDKSNEISISNQDQKETGEANQIIKLIE